MRRSNDRHQRPVRRHARTPKRHFPSVATQLGRDIDGPRTDRRRRTRRSNHTPTPLVRVRRQSEFDEVLGGTVLTEGMVPVREFDTFRKPIFQVKLALRKSAACSIDAIAARRDRLVSGEPYVRARPPRSRSRTIQHLLDVQLAPRVPARHCRHWPQVGTCRPPQQRRASRRALVRSRPIEPLSDNQRLGAMPLDPEWEC